MGSGGRIPLSRLQIHLDDQTRAYSGRELCSHFAYRTFGLLGDSAVAFVGPCRVDLEDMVDLEDVRKQEPIFSPRMLHVIVELFSRPLPETVLYQRLLGRVAADLLGESLPSGEGRLALEVRGDDLYVEQRKASVSIATSSPVSSLIHWGLNVETAGTPLPTWGLAEAGLDPEGFGRELLHRYAAEFDDIHRAVCKVRGTP